jgi:hypothetical protein
MEHHQGMNGIGLAHSSYFEGRYRSWGSLELARHLGAAFEHWVRQRVQAGYLGREFQQHEAPRTLILTKI